LKSLADKNNWVDFLVEADKVRVDIAPILSLRREKHKKINS
jgi:hypothetical protein